MTFKIPDNSGEWWQTPIVIVLGSLKQEDSEFEDNLGCIKKPSYKNKAKPANQNQCLFLGWNIYETVLIANLFGLPAFTLITYIILYNFTEEGILLKIRLDFSPNALRFPPHSYMYV